MFRLTHDRALSLPLINRSEGTRAGAALSQGIFASFADWLSISIPKDVYEGDQVVIRCSGKNNDRILSLKYYKNGSPIATYNYATSYIISNARRSDSGSYLCEAIRELHFYSHVTEKSRTIWLTVQGEDLTLHVDESGKE